MARLDQHSLDEIVELWERLAGRVDDERLERLPLAFPLVPVEARLFRRHTSSLPPVPVLSNTRSRYYTRLSMKVLLVGSGGREHALAWKLAQSPALTGLHAAPGNPGIAALGSCHPLRMDDLEGLLGLCREQEIDLVVVGPEAPLVAGIADGLRRAGVAVFGPGAQAARIEGSKAFAKEVMRAAGVPTAAELSDSRRRRISSGFSTGTRAPTQVGWGATPLFPSWPTRTWTRSSTSSIDPSSPSCRAAGPPTSASYMRGSCSRTTVRASSSSTAGSAIPRRRPSCPGWRGTCSPCSRPQPRGRWMPAASRPQLKQRSRSSSLRPVTRKRPRREPKSTGWRTRKRSVRSSSTPPPLSAATGW